MTCTDVKRFAAAVFLTSSSSQVHCSPEVSVKSKRTEGSPDALIFVYLYGSMGFGGGGTTQEKIMILDDMVFCSTGVEYPEARLRVGLDQRRLQREDQRGEHSLLVLRNVEVDFRMAH